MIRLMSTTSLSVLYALALGGIVSIAVYLPVYLSTALRLEWSIVVTRMAVMPLTTAGITSVRIPQTPEAVDGKD